MLLNKKILCTLFSLVLVLFVSANAQKQQVILSIEGYDVIEGTDYTTDDLEETCDDYKLGFIKGMFKMFAEKAGVKAGLYFVKEIGKPTAFAFSDAMDADSADGSVVIGKKLFADIVTTDWKSDDGSIQLYKFNVLQALIYHELAHLKQFKDKSSLTGKERELDADYRAGYMMGDYAAAANQEATALKFAESAAYDGATSLFSKGDYEFNDSKHHGTKVQRITAFLKGFSDAVKADLENLEKPGSLEVKVGIGIKILALDSSGAPNLESLNSSQFDGTKTQKVNFLIELESIVKGKRIDFTLRHDYISPDKLLFCTVKTSEFLDKEKPAAFFNGSCMPKSGVWKKGNYKVIIFVNNNKVAEGSFVIK